MNKGSQEDIESAVGRTIERVARESYGRLVAYLSVHTHDLASAEDALSEALVSALGTVTDASGGVVPNAKVTITEVGTGQVYNILTGAGGEFVRRISR